MNFSAVAIYIAALLLTGVAMAVFGTLLPLGGGSTVALVGAAAIGAALVLIGIRMMKPDER
ncbi:hypothetical protein [Microbacterium atlanticum]|uniref:hypothetical protein n=1 Tax=Microbacterium atlanticum TaxID=2782168 RepID=UPI001888871F|nr:hypothetical protein [Microbacterium atlanticum]